jgi:predicted kinase
MALTPTRYNESQLLIVSGLPRGGKSSVCDQWVRFEIELDRLSIIYRGKLKTSNERPRVIVCADDIRKALHGCRWSGVAEEMVHGIQGVMIRSFLSRGFHIICDGTNTTKSSIKRLLSFYPNAEYFILDTPIEECKNRADNSNQKDLFPIIERMNEQLCEWKNNADEFYNQLREEVRKIPEPRIALI